MSFFSNLFGSRRPVAKPSSVASMTPVSKGVGRMNVSEAGMKFLIAYEGLERKGGQARYAPKGTNLKSENPSRYYVYDDPVGLLTIGIGHLMKQSELSSGMIVINGHKVPYKNGLTLEQVMDLKRQDMESFVRTLNKIVKVPVTQSMFDALASISFNIGVGAISKSTLIKKLNAKDYYGAADQFPRWNKSRGKVLSGLTRRRNQERAMFLSEISKV